MILPGEGDALYAQGLCWFAADPCLPVIFGFFSNSLTEQYIKVLSLRETKSGTEAN